MSLITLLLIQTLENKATEKLKDYFKIEIYDKKKEYKLEDYKGIIIQGDEDITNVQSESLKDLIFSAFRLKKPVVAMDCGPVVLAELGFLVGKCATVNTEYISLIHDKGAIVFDETIVIDKNLITTSFKIPETELMETIKKKI